MGAGCTHSSLKYRVNTGVQIEQTESFLQSWSCVPKTQMQQVPTRHLTTEEGLLATCPWTPTTPDTTSCCSPCAQAVQFHICSSNAHTPWTLAVVGNMSTSSSNHRLSEARGQRSKRKWDSVGVQGQAQKAVKSLKLGKTLTTDGEGRGVEEK